MALLKGKFDPSLFNSTVLAAQFREILKQQLDEGAGTINLLYAFQELLDQLNQKGIIV